MMSPPPSPATDGAAEPSAVEIMASAGRCAAMGRRVKGKDPLLLLMAARLERRVGVEELADLPGAVSPVAASIVQLEGPAVDGRLGFEALLLEATQCAAPEGQLVDELAAAARREPVGRPRVRRWSGGLAARTGFTARLRQTTSASPGIGLLWSSSSVARLDLLAMSGPTASLDIVSGAGFLTAAAMVGDLVVRVVNRGDQPAQFSLVLDGLSPSGAPIPS